MGDMEGEDRGGAGAYQRGGEAGDGGRDRAVEVRMLTSLAIEAPPSACVCAASTTS